MEKLKNSSVQQHGNGSTLRPCGSNLKVRHNNTPLSAHSEPGPVKSELVRRSIEKQNISENALKIISDIMNCVKSGRAKKDDVVRRYKTKHYAIHEIERFAKLWQTELNFVNELEKVSKDQIEDLIDQRVAKLKKTQDFLEQKVKRIEELTKAETNASGPAHMAQGLQEAKNKNKQNLVNSDMFGPEYLMCKHRSTINGLQRYIDDLDNLRWAMLSFSASGNVVNIIKSDIRKRVQSQIKEHQMVANELSDGKEIFVPKKGYDLHCKRVKRATDVTFNMVNSIIEASKTGNLTPVFFKTLLKRLNEIEPKPAYWRGMYEQFNRLFPEYEKDAKNTTAQRFCDKLDQYIKTYLGGIRTSRSPSARIRSELALEDFVYNTFVLPYQRNAEGSCVPSSMLIKFWHDSPIEYMDSIYSVVERDEVNFVAFGGPDKWIDTSEFGHYEGDDNIGKDDVRRRVYQKLISALLSINDKAADKVKETLVSKISEICKKHGIKDEKAILSLCDVLLSRGVIWDHDFWKIPLCACTDMCNAEIEAMKVVESELKWILKSSKKDQNFRKMIKEIAEEIARLKVDIGSSGLIEQFSPKFGKPTGYVKFPLKVENGVFKIKDFQKVLDGVKFGSHIEDKTKRLCEGQFVNVISDDHGFTIIVRYLDIKNLPLHTPILIGHLNYEDFEYEVDGVPKRYDNSIYMERISEDEVELTNYGEPFFEDISELYIYGDFLTKYEINGAIAVHV